MFFCPYCAAVFITWTIVGNIKHHSKPLVPLSGAETWLGVIWCSYHQLQKNIDTIIATIWRDRKTACLVRIQLAVKVGDRHVYMVYVIVIGRLWHLFHCILLDQDRLVWVSALPLLIHVSRLGFFYYLDVAVDTSFSETWPPSGVAYSAGLTPCGRTGIPHCCMVECDELTLGFTFINVVRKTLKYGQGY